jgi:hypothetical protein
MPRPAHADHDVRDQEVLRANRELAAYFKGERTEREARAALKIIKAYIRERQHTPVDKRRSLPGMKRPSTPVAKAKPVVRKMRRRRPKKTEITEITEITGTQTEQQSNGGNGEG